MWLVRVFFSREDGGGGREGGGGEGGENGLTYEFFELGVRFDGFDGHGLSCESTKRYKDLTMRFVG